MKIRIILPVLCGPSALTRAKFEQCQDAMVKPERGRFLLLPACGRREIVGVTLAADRESYVVELAPFRTRDEGHFAEQVEILSKAGWKAM